MLQHIRIIQTSSSMVLIPTARPASTGWYAEHEEIGQSDDLIDEIVVTPRKCSARQPLQRARRGHLARRNRDGGQHPRQQRCQGGGPRFFAGTGLGSQPVGLAAVDGLSTSSIGLTLNGFSDAVRQVEDAGGRATIAWMNPAAWADFTNDLTGHAAIAPTSQVQRALLGVPVETTNYCPSGTIWVADGGQLIAVMRTDGSVDVSRHAGFTRDQTLVRVTSRIGFAHPFPGTVCRLAAA